MSHQEEMLGIRRKILAGMVIGFWLTAVEVALLAIALVYFALAFF